MNAEQDETIGSDGRKKSDDIVIEEIDSHYHLIETLCQQAITEILSLSGLVSADDEIDIGEYFIGENSIHRIIGVVYLEFIPIVNGSTIGKKVKCSISNNNKDFQWKVLGGFIDSIDGTGPSEYYAYDDWTDPENPTLILTGIEEE